MTIRAADEMPAYVPEWVKTAGRGACAVTAIAVSAVAGAIMGLPLGLGGCALACRIVGLQYKRIRDPLIDATISISIAVAVVETGVYLNRKRITRLFG